MTSEDCLQPQRYSSWSKLTRVTARVDRFLENCRLPAALRREGALKPDKVTAAGRRYIRQAQQEVFGEEIRALKAGREIPGGSKLLPLRPVLDKEGVLRCDGRLRYAECLPWETRYPIILPCSHCVTMLIVKHAHEQDHHAGTNQVQYYTIAQVILVF